MPELSIHESLLQFSYVAIFILMVANGMVNTPSSQLLYLVAGYFISTDALVMTPVIIIGAIGNTIGNMVTFLLIKRYGVHYAEKFLPIRKEKFDAIQETLTKSLDKHGDWFIVFGKCIPSIKAFVPALAALASLDEKKTALLFFIGSLIWALGITSLGVFFGEHVDLKTLAIVSFTAGITILLIAYKKFHNALPR